MKCFIFLRASQYTKQNSPKYPPCDAHKSYSEYAVFAIVDLQGISSAIADGYFS